MKLSYKMHTPVHPWNSGPIQWPRRSKDLSRARPVGHRWKEKVQRTYYSYRRLPGDSAPLGVVNTAVFRGGDEVHSLEVRRGTGPQGTMPRFVTHLYDMTRLYDYGAAHDRGGDPLMLQKKIQGKKPKEKSV